MKYLMSGSEHVCLTDSCAGYEELREVAYEELREVAYAENVVKGWQPLYIFFWNGLVGQLQDIMMAVPLVYRSTEHSVPADPTMHVDHVIPSARSAAG